jgi:hypothetical protein
MSFCALWKFRMQRHSEDFVILLPVALLNTEILRKTDLSFGLRKKDKF